MGPRRRTVVGIVSGIAAAALVGIYTLDVTANASREREAALARYGGEQAQVIVAIRDLASGEVVTSDDVEERPWLVDLLPENVADSPDQVVGQTVAYPIAADEPILTTRLGATGEELAVPDDLVAISVPADEVVAVGGELAAGSLVDVYSNASADAALLVANVQVLRTSADAGPSAGSTLGSAGSAHTSLKWVTLAVRPEMVEQLVSASRQGGLYFALPGKQAQAAGQQQADGAGGGDVPAVEATDAWQPGSQDEASAPLPDGSAGGEQ